MLDLGLGYLSLERSTPTLSPGELQRLRLATQVRSNLFGVVYVLDEPSAGLHPADTEALLAALDRLKASGNSLFVVEHDLDVIRHADWIVDVGPAAGEQGGHILYSGPPDGPRTSRSNRKPGGILFGRHRFPSRTPRSPKGWLRLHRRHAQQSEQARRRLSAGRLHHRDRRVGLGQVEPGQPGAGRTGGRASGPRPSPPTTDEGEELERRDADRHRRRDRRRHGSDQAPGARRSKTDRPHARARTWRPTPACSITFASCSPPPKPLAPVATTPAAFRSTWPRAAAKPARAKALSSSSCCSCPASMRPAPPVTAPATTPKRWKSNIATDRSPTCWA